MLCRIASLRSRATVSRLISFTSTTSRFGAPFSNCERILPIISVARCASLRILVTAVRNYIEIGIFAAELRRQVLALVIAPLIG